MAKISKAFSATGVAMSMIVFALGTTQAAEPASVSKGAQTWADNCDRCHKMRDPRDFGADQWRVIVTHMRIRAGLTGGEARDVLAFLQQNGAMGPVSGSSAANDASATAAAPSAGAADGQRVYEGTCIACHGPDGKGAIAGVPDLTAAAGPLSQSDSVLFNNIKNGFQTPGSPLAMPAKGGNPTLSDEQIRAVLAYLHQEFGVRAAGQ